MIASYETFHSFVAFLYANFLYNLGSLLSEVLYLQQTFTDCVSILNTFLYVEIIAVTANY